MKDEEGTRTEEGEEAVRGLKNLRKGTVGEGMTGEGTGNEGMVEVAVGDGPHWKGEYDDYDKWFQTVMPGKDPQATLDGVDGDGWNTWCVCG